MKQSCKNIDITDPETIYPWVLECLEKHRKRYDFRRFLTTVGGMTRTRYKASLTDKQLLEEPARAIAQEAVRQIRDRKLELTPVRMTPKQDRSSFKIRYIGCEGPMQQVLDYIAVKSAWDVFSRRIVPQQCSSIRGRGPSYGARMIHKWIVKDNRAMKLAIKHKRRYTRRCKYFVKLDISKCYPSMRKDIFMPMFRRDCGNVDICWLWDTLLGSHNVDGYEGFMIGALPSQWAAQYIMSYMYRYVAGLHSRRGKQLISHCLIYMDDILLLGPDRKHLKQAVQALAQYAYANFHLSIKPNWHILKLSESPIDMMGHVFHSDGAITVRPRIFLRTRRLALRIARHGASLRQCKRMIAYKGYFQQKHLYIPRYLVNKKYRLFTIFRMARARLKQEASRCRSPLVTQH